LTSLEEKDNYPAFFVLVKFDRVKKDEEYLPGSCKDKRWLIVVSNIKVEELQIAPKYYFIKNKTGKGLGINRKENKVNR
jgi:hypothetical protein